ncbi:MAG: protein kinase [Candidatus Woesearchaeota archaeon]|nr:protein kinase [Candidatus Woesearchaeota archaeon]
MAETEPTKTYTREYEKDAQKKHEKPELPTLNDYAVHRVHQDHPNVFYGTLKSTGLEVVVKGATPIKFRNYEAEDVGKICLCYEHATQDRLDHGNILAPLELYYQDDNFYLILPKVGKSDLNPDNRAIRLLPDSVKLTLLAQIANALAYCHKNEVVHLDVKGKNIRVENKKAILIDFGAARRLGETHELMDGLHVSTPDIVAPEHFFSHTITPSADVFSLSCLAYKLMTGKEPFMYDDNLEVLIYRKPSHNKEAVEKYKAGESIRRGMSINRRERPGMKEFEEMLKEEAARWNPLPSEQPSEPSPVLVQ